MNEQLKNDLHRLDTSSPEVDLTSQILGAIHTKKQAPYRYTYQPLIRKKVVLWIIAFYVVSLLFAAFASYAPIAEISFRDLHWNWDSLIALTSALKWVLVVSGSGFVLLFVQSFYLKPLKKHS